MVQVCNTGLLSTKCCLWLTTSQK